MTGLNYAERGALIAARIRTAADSDEVAARIVINQVRSVAQRWSQGDISGEKYDGMKWALRASVATSGYAEEAAANRETETIASAVNSLIAVEVNSL